MSQSLPTGLADKSLEQRLTDGLAAVEARLHEATSSPDALIAGSAKHLLSAGGKRMRPLLTLLAAETGDPKSPGIIDAAAVVELTHLASLYHDDVIDEASVRRGVPTAHQQFGSTIAILAGDWLFARACQLVSDLGPECVSIQATTFARLCEGQIRETAGPRVDDDPVAFHLQVLADKTGALIAGAAHLGAKLAGAPASQVAALIAFGEKVGVAFQLADDVIDLTQDPAVTGKTQGTDLREGVPTMPRLLLEQVADHDRSAGLVSSVAIDLVADLNTDLSDDVKLADVVARLAAHPVTEQSRSVAEQWSDQAVAELAAMADSSVKRALVDFARMSVARLG